MRPESLPIVLSRRYESVYEALAGRLCGRAQSLEVYCRHVHVPWRIRMLCRETVNIVCESPVDGVTHKERLGDTVYEEIGSRWIQVVPKVCGVGLKAGIGGWSGARMKKRSRGGFFAVAVSH